MLDNPVLIIELYLDISQDDKNKLKNIIESFLEIQNANRVKIYDSNVYTFESIFSQTIYEEYSKALKETMCEE